MFSLLKRFRDVAVIAALLLVPLGVYFAHARRPSERSRLDRFFIVVTAPIERGVAWTVGGALDGWRGYVALRGARERAQELSRRVNELELERLDKARLEGENARLRKLLDFAQAEPGFRVVGARVIGVRLDPKGLQLIRVDRGADDGVEKLMPVVVAQGVVGRVHAVTGTTADVLLVSDLNSSIAVRVARSRARANVRGTGDPAVCRLDYALRSDDLQENDDLVTSGTDGIFPRGLPVGRIANLKKSGQGLYQKADVVPAVDVTKLEEVLVLRSRAEGGRDEPRPATTAPTSAPKSPVPVAQGTKTAATKTAATPAPPRATASAGESPQPAPRAAADAKPSAPALDDAPRPAAALIPRPAASAGPGPTAPGAAPRPAAQASSKPLAAVPRPALPKAAAFVANPALPPGAVAPAPKPAKSATARHTAAKPAAPPTRSKPPPAATPSATSTPAARRAEARVP